MNDIQTIQNKISDTSGEIVMYQPDETIRLEVRLGEDTVWLNQQQMAELFATSKQLISHHIANILKDKELDGFSVVKQYLTTAADAYNHPYYTAIDDKIDKCAHGGGVTVNTDWDGERHLEF